MQVGAYISIPSAHPSAGGVAARCVPAALTPLCVFLARLQPTPARSPDCKLERMQPCSVLPHAMHGFSIVFCTSAGNLPALILLSHHVVAIANQPRYRPAVCDAFHASQRLLSPTWRLAAVLDGSSGGGLACPAIAPRYLVYLTIVVLGAVWPVYIAQVRCMAHGPNGAWRMAQMNRNKQATAGSGRCWLRHAVARLLSRTWLQEVLSTVSLASLSPTAVT